MSQAQCQRRRDGLVADGAQSRLLWFGSWSASRSELGTHLYLPYICGRLGPVLANNPKRALPGPNDFYALERDCGGWIGALRHHDNAILFIARGNEIANRNIEGAQGVVS